MGKMAARRSYKDSLFRMVFREKGELLSLYNAINGTDYDDPEELIVTTIEDVLYMGRKNDVSFLIDDVMNLYEHQSSWNPNMPLRGLLYISMLYQGFIEQNHLDIYSSTLLKLPVPKYVVFYNGAGGEPDQQELRLSESFIKQDEGSCLECKALILNINYGQNQELMKACRKLYEYSYFVGRVREYLNEGLTLNAAIDSGIQECIRSDILKPFLLKHRGEVKQVILTEYNEELHAKTLIEEGRREEREKNAQILQQEREKNAQILQNNIKFLRQLLLQMLESKGRVSGEITERIHSENNPDILQAWASFAVSCDSLEALEREILREEPRSSEGEDGKQDSE